MPLYEFECPEGTITERIASLNTKHITCPKCGKKARKIMSPSVRSTFEFRSGDGRLPKKRIGKRSRNLI